MAEGGKEKRTWGKPSAGKPNTTRNIDAGLASMGRRLQHMADALPEGAKKTAILTALASIMTAILAGCGVIEMPSLK